MNKVEFCKKNCCFIGYMWDTAGEAGMNSEVMFFYGQEKAG